MVGMLTEIVDGIIDNVSQTRSFTIKALGLCVREYMADSEFIVDYQRQHSPEIMDSNLGEKATRSSCFKFGEASS